MQTSLGKHCYGKSDIILTGVTNGRLREMMVSVEIIGGMDEVFRDGDNRGLLPTTSMDNAAAALLHEHLNDPPEAFAARLARELSVTCAASVCKVEVSEIFWSPESSGYSVREFPERWGSIFVTAECCGPEQVILHAGYRSIGIFKPSGTSFTNFLRDSFTDAQDSQDRPVRGTVSITWRYKSSHGDHRETGPLVRRAFLAAFTRHQGSSVQHSLHAAASEAVHSSPYVDALTVDYESLDSAPVDLARFGRSSPNVVTRSWPLPRHRISLTILAQDPES